MKRRVFLVAVLMLCTVLTVSAAFNPFGYAESVRNSGSLIDVGIGYGGYGIPIHAVYDKVVPIDAGSMTLPLSFGGAVDVSFFGNSAFSLCLSVCARACWHIDIGMPALDIYAGPSLGFRMITYPTITVLGREYKQSSSMGFDGGAVAGVRYAFSDTMAAFLETGYTGLTYAKVGITFIL